MFTRVELGEFANFTAKLQLALTELKYAQYRQYIEVEDIEE